VSWLSVLRAAAGTRYLGRIWLRLLTGSSAISWHSSALLTKQ
jgi:hypothetical protein